MTASMKQYREIIEDRPKKLSEDDVNYRPSESEEKCGSCLHFYERRVDRFGVCELFRSDETDRKGVQRNYVCDFFTEDGKDFPLY